MKWSKFKWSLRRSRHRPSDPLRHMGGQVFAEHSRELLEQAKDFVREVAEGQDPTNAPPAPAGRAYMEFVRRRKQSLEKGLLADLALLEWYGALEREAARHEILERFGIGEMTEDAAGSSTAKLAPQGAPVDPLDANAKDVNDDSTQ